MTRTYLLLLVVFQIHLEKTTTKCEEAEEDSKNWISAPVKDQTSTIYQQSPSEESIQLRNHVPGTDRTGRNDLFTDEDDKYVVQWPPVVAEKKRKKKKNKKRINDKKADGIIPRNPLKASMMLMSLLGFSSYVATTAALQKAQNQKLRNQLVAITSTQTPVTYYVPKSTVSTTTAIISTTTSGSEQANDEESDEETNGGLISEFIADIVITMFAL